MLLALLSLVVLAPPDGSDSWLGVSLLKDGRCVRVVGIARPGPFSKAGGALNQCIVRVAGQKVTAPEDVLAVVSAQPEGRVVEIELEKAQLVRARLELRPSDEREQICRGTTEQQVLVRIVSEQPKVSRGVAFKSPVTVGDIVKKERLSGSIAVVLRTCKDQVGEFIDQPAPDLRLSYGSTLFVTPNKETERSVSRRRVPSSDEHDAL